MDRSRTSEPRLSLAELTEAAEVSVRTVRYYIAEGLLPPPLGSGPASFYTSAHLERLKLIGRLKDAYLPLKEIRRRLTGVEDTELPRLMALNDAELFDPGTWEGRGGAKSVSSYLDRVQMEERKASRRLSSQPSAWAMKERDAVDTILRDSSDRARYRLSPKPAPRVDEDSVDEWSSTVTELDSAEPTTLREVSAQENEIDRVAGPSWRRIALGDEIELTVSDRAWRRNREKLEWLANWARKVLR